MSKVDKLVELARTRSVGPDSDKIRIRRDSLRLLVGLIDRLREDVRAVQLPNQNTQGQHHSSAPATEKLAALKVMPKTGTQRMAVLEAIVNSDDGLTDYEVSDLTGIYLYSAAPRRNELVAGGWVKETDARRSTANGGEAIVWVATGKARAALRWQDK